MTHNEMELVKLIREHSDPEQAMRIAVEIISQYIERPLSCSEPAAACPPARA